LLHAQGNLREAQAAFGESLAISQRLAELDPINAGWQSDLAGALSRVGDVLQAQDRSEEARQVVVSLEEMARTTSEQPGAEAARQALEFQTQALGIALKVRESNPQSAFYGRTAAVSFFLTSQRAHAAGDEELANRCLAGCHQVLHELVTAGVELDPQMKQLYQQLNPAAGGPPGKP
jgi:hypothetical protein